MAAYALEGPRWSSHTITWSLATTNYGNQPTEFSQYFTQASYIAEIKAAFQAWQAVADLTFVQVSDSASANIRLGLSSIDGAYNTLAVTHYTYQSGSQGSTFVAAAIAFDTAEPYQSSGGQDKLPSGVTFQSVAIHEIGHAIGIDHNATSGSIMNAMASGSVTGLSSADVAAVQELYGARPIVTVAAILPVEKAGDFNGDRRADILWRHDSGLLTTWNAAGSGFSGTSVDRADPSWKVVAVGDFNNDQRDDLVWRHDSGLLTTWTKTASGFAGGATQQVDASWKVAGTGDFNGDGRDDILWRNDNGLLTAWTSTGSGFAGTRVDQADTTWKVVGTGDFNGDGRDDILWQHASGSVTTWTATGSGFAGNAVNTSDATWHALGTGDFNGDGRDDILWRNDNGLVTTWTSTGSGFVGGGVTSSNTSWELAGTGDYNGDGKADLLWRQASGTLSEWDSTGSGFTPHDVAKADSGWHIMA